MLSELDSLNLNLCSKQCNKNFVLHLIVVPQLSSDWQHNYSTKTRQAGHGNRQSMYSLISMGVIQSSQGKQATVTVSALLPITCQCKCSFICLE